MLEAEVELYDDFPNLSLDELVDLFQGAQTTVLDDKNFMRSILEHHSEYGKEAIFSTIRVVRAALTEIEYRIKEDKF